MNNLHKYTYQLGEYQRQQYTNYYQYKTAVKYLKFALKAPTTVIHVLSIQSINVLSLAKQSINASLLSIQS